MGTRSLVQINSVSESGYGVDNKIIKTFLPYENILEKDMLKVKAVTKEELVKDKQDRNLANLLAVLLLEQGTRETKLAHHFSYFKRGGTTTFLPEGEITVGKIYELMSFENKMVYLHLLGKQIQRFLYNNAEKLI